MRTRTLVFLAFALVFAVVLFTVQARETHVKIKEVPMQYTDPSNGKEMFTSYCAVCHGVEGKRHGPAVPALKTVPPDLTLLSQSHEGKFPMMEVMNSIRGDFTMTTAHGSKVMPIWGPLLSEVGQSRTHAQLRIRNISLYIESMQAKYGQGAVSSATLLIATCSA